MKTMESIKKIKALLVLTLIMGLAVASCKKQQGPAGPAGTNGTNGTNGISISSFTLSISTWTWNSGNKWRESSIVNLSITQNVVDMGALMVYEDIGGVYSPLPFSFSYPSQPTFLTSYYFGTNLLTIYYSASDFIDYGNMTKTFKIVIIPPAMRKPNVNYQKYEEVKAAHNLVE